MNAREVGSFWVALYDMHRGSSSAVLAFEKIARFSDVGFVELQKPKANKVFRIAYVPEVTLLGPVEERPFRSSKVVFEVREGWCGVRAMVAFVVNRVWKVDR